MNTSATRIQIVHRTLTSVLHFNIHFHYNKKALGASVPNTELDTKGSSPTHVNQLILHYITSDRQLITSTHQQVGVADIFRDTRRSPERSKLPRT